MTGMLEARGLPPDTPDDSPESEVENGSGRGRRAVLLTRPATSPVPYPSPPASPVYPERVDKEEQLVSSPVEMPHSTSMPLPPTALMQGYRTPPDASLMRGSYPPAGPSRALLNPPQQGTSTARHHSAPLAMQTPTNANHIVQSDPTRQPESLSYPGARIRREEQSSDPSAPMVSQISPQRPSSSRTRPKRSSAVPPPGTMLAQGVPLAADVCVECMMRDRDMADVDVTTPGAWDRASDVDFYDALRAEEADIIRRRESTASSRVNGAASGSDGDHGSRWSLGQPGNASSRESASLETSGRSRTRRIGRGNELTEASLKLWTSMKPAASSHRWRTLQLYLREQSRLLALEQASQRANEVERDRFEEALREQSSKDLAASRKSFTAPRNRSSTVLPSGITVERVDVQKDEKQTKKARAKAAQERGRRASTSIHRSPYDANNHPYLHPASQAAASASSLFTRAGDSPERRFSSHQSGSASRKSLPLFAQSQTDLRPPSPQTQKSRPSSLAPSERPMSSIFRGAQSASASVYSLAPSGSMIDMHLGLEQDRHPTLRAEDSELVRQISDDEVIQRSTTKKSKTLARLFSKFNLRSAPPSPPPMTILMPSPRGSTSFLATSPVDEGPLEPPFPSYLASDVGMHRRSPTVSTAGSSQPVTPDLTSAMADLILPSQLPLRREKSLPALPPEDELDLGASMARPMLSIYDRTASAPLPNQLPLQTAMGLGTHTPSTDSTEHIGGGRKAKASRVQSKFFGFNGWRKGGKRAESPQYDGGDLLLNEKTRIDAPQEAVIRDDLFIATRYPSLSSA